MSYNHYDNPIFFKKYSEMDRSKYGLKASGEWSMLEPLFPDFKDKTVLDLGCGYGWHCKYAIENQANSVLGIDLSEKMIEEALKRNADSKIDYQVCNLLDYEYPSSVFDIVLSNLVLHYIEDLNSIYKNVFQTLKKGGTFIFNIEHPTFTAGINQEWIYDENHSPLYWPVDQYYYPGKRKTNFLNHEITKYHHTMTQIIQGLIDYGFTIENLIEVEPNEEMLKIDGMMHEMRRPMMLIVKARK